MYNSLFVSPSYVSYTDGLVSLLPTLFRDIICFKRGRRNRPINKILKCVPYLDLISFKANDESLIQCFSYYLDKNISSCYSIYIPIKFSFKSLKEFCINYNILNIPKMAVSGELLLKGYSRVSILYLKSIIKYVYFRFKGKGVFHYVVRFKDSVELHIYVDELLQFTVSVNSYDLTGWCLDKCMVSGSGFITYPRLGSGVFDKLFTKKKRKGLSVVKRLVVFNSFLYFSRFLTGYFVFELGAILGSLFNVYRFKKRLCSVDNLFNKYVNCLTDILFNLFKDPVKIFNFIRYFRFLLYEQEKHESLSLILFKENLIINPTIHYLNQLNTLSCLHDKCKINVFGYSSASSNSFIVSPSIRKVKGDYLGFINMLYTSDGEACGLLSILTNNLLLLGHKLKIFSAAANGFLSSSGFGVDIFSRSLSKVKFQEFCELKKKNTVFKVFEVEMFINGEFKVGTKESGCGVLELDLTSILSVTELVIPFLFNNDPCRGLMGSKMHTQALPLVFNTLPYVFTKYNALTSFVSDRCVCSFADGIIVSVTESVIVVQDSLCRYSEYYLCPFNVSDYDSYFRYRPVVREGERVWEGQVLAVPKDVDNFEYTLGFNNFVNYGMYYGYEHEDALIINKDLLVNDVLTSLSFDIYEMFLSFGEGRYVELTIPRLKKYNRWFIKAKRDSGFVSRIKHLFEDHVLMSKVKYEASEVGVKGKVKHIKKLFLRNKKLNTSRYYVKIKPGGEGRLVKNLTLSYSCNRQIDSDKTAKHFVYLYLKFFIAKIDRVKVGDKLCGRHGNKGVISKVVESVDMPYTVSGICPSTITSPIGALARMNVGQFLEGTCGYLCSVSGNRIKAPINVKKAYLGSSIFRLSEIGVWEDYSSCLGSDKFVLKNFKTGCRLKNYAYCAVAYYFKLMHTSKSKYHYRTVGRYSSITQQPVQGKSCKGSQRFGEMEVWALEAHGASYNLREMSLVKINYKSFRSFGSVWSCSETFKSLILELKNILINIQKDNHIRLANVGFGKEF